MSALPVTHSGPAKTVGHSAGCGRFAGVVEGRAVKEMRFRSTRSPTPIPRTRAFGARAIASNAALPVFRKVFVSYELGARKPERAAFEAIARAIGVPLERILFFDDTAENVAGARAAGVAAIQVRGPQDVADALRPWLQPT